VIPNDVATIEADPEDTERSGRPSRERSSPELPGNVEHVLCVEDDPDIRALVELALQSVGGLRVTSCASGIEALARLPEVRPDVVLLDVMMPEMDGLETFRRMATGDDAPPVIFMTAKVQPQEVRRYLGLGALGVIAKPFDPMTLAADIRRLCGCP